MIPGSRELVSMHILLCNERLLFRFGHDRVLSLLGRHLHDCGHRVTVLVNHYDQDSVSGWTDRVIQMPEPADYFLSNEHAADYVESHWESWFLSDGKPDLAIVGGWPFFSTIDVLEKFGVRTVYFDCGAVPLDGYEGGQREVQLKLRELRCRHLPNSTHIVTNSVFTAESQSRSDSGGKVPITPILLGADHLEKVLWANSGEAQNDRPFLKEKVDELIATGKPLVFHLGRWEPHSYKNSDAMFPILDGITKALPDTRVIILADPATKDIPFRFRNRVIPVGFPSDDELQDLMKRVDLGIVPSRWEGFGLPLAEMQWLRRPVLAFTDGAHPEVAVDPWYLCRTNEEMVEKSVHILTGLTMREIPEPAYKKFRKHFLWDRVLREWESLIEDVFLRDRQMHLIIDVTNASIDTANSGVIRVTRQLARVLQEKAKTSFVRWDAAHKSYVFLTKNEYCCLSQYDGPTLAKGAVVSRGKERIRLDERLRDYPAERTWLCITETSMAPVLAAGQKFARNQGWNVAAIFYDAIPILHPEFVKDRQILHNHAAYMRQLADCNAIIPISEFSAQCLRDFWRDQNVSGTSVQVDLLAGQLGATDTSKVAEQARAAKADGHVARILCVSTIEPRKNHLRLIDACLELKRRRPDLKWQLDLVGNRYAGGEELADQVNAACKNHLEINWLGVVDDETLIDLYAKADFTVYPSLIEGYGVPIVESLAFGKPCLCSNGGVMAELAADGGCLTVDVRSVDALSKAVERLLCDSALLEDLSEQARSRPVRTWDEYARDFAMILSESDGQRGSETDHQIVPFPANGGKHHASEPDHLPFDLDNTLYPQCLCDRWQMNHSERMTLRALLEHIKPRCAIEVGTFWGGSLSLMAQHAQVVFSIDIEPMSPSVRVFPNVSFLTGPSQVLLPKLLDELSKQQLDPQLILIDGDHSREGVARDLNIILERSTRVPMWVVMHDSMNPGCRAGMLDVDWAANPHVHFVDLDFVPGRLVETGGGTGELWGGLGLACLLPHKRQESLTVKQSAQQMMETLMSRKSHVDYTDHPLRQENLKQPL